MTSTRMILLNYDALSFRQVCTVRGIRHVVVVVVVDVDDVVVVVFLVAVVWKTIKHIIMHLNHYCFTGSVALIIIVACTLIKYL